MVNDRHVETPPWIAREIEDYRTRRMPLFLGHVKRTSSNLKALADNARDLAAFLSFVEHDPRESADLLRLAARSYAGLFLVEWENPRKPIRLNDQTEVFCDDHPSESYIYAGRWLSAFFGCLACRDKEFLDRLCALPTERLRDSSTKGPEYAHVFAEACRRLWRKDPSCAQLLLKAMEQTDPLKYKSVNPPYVLHVSVPLIHLVYCVGVEDKEFGQHLREALKLHREYWDSTRDLRMDWSGWLAFDLLGVAAWAHDRGLKFDVRSDYIPWSIVTGEAFKPKAK